MGARMAPFGGWDMPIQYAGILAEHAWTRSHSSIFDTCHMGEFELSGPTAATDLEKLLTQQISGMAEGACRYGYLLREDGGVLDDLTCYRLEPERFMLVVNAATTSADADWIQAHLSAQTTFHDISSQTGKLDIQGPNSRRAIEEVLQMPLPDLSYFSAREVEIAGVTCLVSRSGYTGEWGYEIYLPAQETVRFWKMFLAGGAIRPAGLGARDTLRLEMGYPLYGHELGVDRSPVAASRGRFISLEKTFIGREAVENDLRKGVSHYLAGLRLAGRRAARAGDRVLAQGVEAGVVTSGSFAPSLGTAVAMAYIKNDLCRPGTQLEIATRGGTLPAEVVSLPFYKKGTARG